MVKCSAPLCGNSTFKKIPEMTFHRFPKDEYMKLAWLTNMKRQDWQPTSSSKLCSKHFESHLIDKSGLRAKLAPGAIPTIFDLLQEMEKNTDNNIKYQLGFARKIIVRDGALPSKFGCQPGFTTDDDDACNIQPKCEQLEHIDNSEAIPTTINNTQSEENLSAEFYCQQYITKAMSDDYVSASQAISLVCDENLQSTEEWEAIPPTQDCEENRLNVEETKDPLTFTNMPKIVALIEAPITTEKLYTQDKSTNTEPIPITTEKSTQCGTSSVHTTFVGLNLCRVCMADDGTISLFSWEEDGQRSEKMVKCAAVEVREGDGLPDSICETCAAELTASYQFALRCEASDKTLRARNDLVKEEPGTEHTENDTSFEYIDDMQLSIEEPEKEEKAKSYEIYDDHSYFVQNKIEINSEKAEIISDHESHLAKYGRKKIIKQTHEKITTKHIMRTRRSGYNKGCFQCPTCEELFTQYNAFEAHMKSHVTGQSFICDICKKCFKSKVIIEQHIRHIHYGEKRRRIYKTYIVKKSLRPGTMCSICGRNMTSISSLLMHIRSHSNEKSYVCQYCGLGYKQNCGLKDHLKNAHADLHFSEKCTCDFCGLTVYSKLKMRRHMRIHVPPKWHKCTLCPRKFPLLEWLKRHKKRHTSTRPYKCKLCSWSFYERITLQKHYLVHTNERKFICNECDKRFKTRSALNCHKASHSEEKPWTCSICGKSFNLKSNLTAHTKRVHFKKS